MAPAWPGPCALALLLVRCGGHDFEDASLDHSAAAIRFEQQGQQAEAERAFQSAARFKPSWSTFQDLGVCMMRRNRLDEAEDAMLRAHSMANTPRAESHVDQNLNVLEQHLAFRRGEEPHSGLSYRRRHAGWRHRTSTGSSRSSSEPGFFSSGDDDDEDEELIDYDELPDEPAVERPELVHQRPRVPFGMPFKRRSTADLDKAKKQSAVFGAPFILTDGMEGWGMLEKWSDTWQDELKALYPQAVTDFYPYNMLSKDRQNPYLSRVPVAIRELETPPSRSRFRPDKIEEEGRYMHLQLTPKMWAALEEKRYMLSERHSFLKNDEWLHSCMAGDVQEEWNLKTHWKIILVGMRGAGMFNHSDTLRTSSWHAHVVGSKWWYVCGHMKNGTQVCFEDVVKPGEILYYPPLWSHETQCLGTPTITVTDTVAHSFNAEGILGKTYGECTGRNSLKFDFSASLCDALERCADFWRQRSAMAGRKWSGARWKPWRENAVDGEVEKKEAILPKHNNYDGRNFIAEEWN